MWLANPAHFATGYFTTQADYDALITDAQGLWGGNVDAAGYGVSNGGYYVFIPGALPGTTYSVTAASWATSVATYTIGAHSLQVGQLVSVTGASPTGWNITQLPVTAITSTTFSVALTGNPGTWVSGGTVQASGVPATNGMVALFTNGSLYTYFGGVWTAGVGTITVLGAVTSVNGITTVGQGVTSILAMQNLTTQSANISTTNLLASTPSLGDYRVTAEITVTTAATSSSTLPSVTISWTNKNGVVISTVLVPTNTGNTTTTRTFSFTCFGASASTAITFSTAGYATSGATSMKYSLDIRLERI